MSDNTLHKNIAHNKIEKLVFRALYYRFYRWF
jgi:hypothetical protein